MTQFLKYSLFTLALAVFSFSLFVGQARADVVSVACSGTSGSPTAVTEADLAGDDVTFTDGGDGWCVLDEAISASSVVINTGVTITHTATDVDGVTITTTGIFEIQEGGVINADTKGCQGVANADGTGPDGSNVCGPQAGWGDGNGSDGGYQGAGYGGLGGMGSSSTFILGGATYGSATAPIFLGSSGGGVAGASLNAGGDGGGLVILSIGGIFTHNGTISVNGGTGEGNNDSRSAGGGSGGSIYITASSLAGSTGIFSANGGSGMDHTIADGGGGGGGRIALLYGSSTFSGLGAEDFTVTGGLGSDTADDGSSGTVYTKNTGSDAVTIYHGFTFDDTDYNVTSWTMDQSADNQYCATGTTTPSLTATNLIIDGTISCDLTTITSFNFSASSSFSVGDGANISITGGGADVDFNIPNANDQAWTNFTFTGAAEGFFTIDDVIGIDMNSSTVSANAQWINLAYLEVDASSTISADSKGCRSFSGVEDGFGPNSSNVCVVLTDPGSVLGAGDGSSSDGGAQGAGYGGTGGLGTTVSLNTGGRSYGSANTPIFFGSSGGSENLGTVPPAGGTGGGYIKLNMTGSFTHNGVVSAKGGAGTISSTSRATGGGSGGSIYITAGSIIEDGGAVGTFSVIGGDGGDGAAHNGGGGGGGRIAIEYGADPDLLVSNLVVATIAAGGLGPDTANEGLVGSLYTLQNVSLTSITITDNSGYTNDSTPVITIVQSGAVPSHIAFSCNAGSNWSDWIAYPDDEVANDDDGPAFDITSGATGCSVTNELKTISAKIKDASSESSTVSDTTTYDTVAPTVLNVTATNVDGTYGADTVISATVQFDSSMAVTGTPQLLLDMNSVDRQANYASVLTDTLTFTYTIVNGDNKTDLDYVGTDSLTLNSGTIKDLAGNSATLTLASPGAVGSLGANKSINIETNPEVNWSSASQSGAENVGTLTVTATLSFTYASDVTIPYTMTGTASSPSDYSITASPLVITAGNASGSITITVVDDVVDELDETVIVTMGVLTNGIKGATDVHTATITDNDSAPTISIDDPTVSEGAGTGTVTVTLTGGSYLGVTVDYTTSTGTAIEGTDFTDATGTLTWAADETGTKTYSITITNDTLDENDKTITNTLSNPTNSTISDSTGTMTITDNDDAPTVAWTASSQSGAESVGTMTIIAQLSAVSGLDVTLPYTLTGTAVGTGTDYSITASPVTITAGSSTTTVTITVVDDALDENSETVISTIGVPTNATVGATTVHTATITDNDEPPVVNWTTSTQSIAESAETITITAELSTASSFTITVPFTVTGTAVGSGVDYTIDSSPVTISAGSTTTDISLTVIEEIIVEPTETVIVTMGTPTNGTKGTTDIHTASITNDDNQRNSSSGTTAPSSTVSSGNTETTTTTENNDCSGITAGSGVKLVWTATSSVNLVNLYYSTDEGETYIKIVGPIQNTESYSWTIPSNLEDNSSIQFKIEGTDLVIITSTYETSSMNVCAQEVSDTTGSDDEGAEDTSDNDSDSTSGDSSDSETEDMVVPIGMALESVLGDKWVQDAEERGVDISDFPTGEIAIGSLVKLPDDGNINTQTDSAVYYIGADHRRHPFPNESVYKTWFTAFFGIKEISQEQMSSIPMGPMVTYRPGSTLVKFPSVNKVYAVDAEGSLRWVASEDLAKAIYGNEWYRFVVDISEAFYLSYTFEGDLLSVTDMTWDTVMAVYKK